MAGKSNRSSSIVFFMDSVLEIKDILSNKVEYMKKKGTSCSIHITYRPLLCALDHLWMVRCWQLAATVVYYRPKSLSKRELHG